MEKLIKPSLSNLLSESVPKLKSILSSYHPNHLPILPADIQAKLPRLRSNVKASIVIPLIQMNNNNTEPSIIFTKRSSNLKQHANEISFPGGHLDPEDGGCLINTAKRETREELIPTNYLGENTSHLGSDGSTSSNDSNASSMDDPRYDFENNLVVIGQTQNVPSAKLVPVTPFLAYFRHQCTSDNIESLYPGNTSEVSQVFTLTISELLELEETMYLKRLGMEGPVYKSKYGDIWGLTALVLKPLLHEVLKPSFLTHDGHTKSLL